MKRSLRLPVLSLAVLMLAALAVPLAAADDAEPRVAPAKLVVTVYYKTPTGKAPLPDVEVFALIDGTSYYGCTNANGKVAFPDVGLGSVWLKALATGPSVNQPRCANTLFLNPDTGRPMFAVFYKNHQGLRLTDSVELSSGRNALKLVAKTPPSARRLCAGLKVTHQGTTGDDLLIGSPANDVINGRGGDDTIDGLAGNDVICGGPGADTISGGPEDDAIWGEGGPDDLDGNSGEDWADGGPGMDACANFGAQFSCETCL